MQNRMWTVVLLGMVLVLSACGASSAPDTAAPVSSASTSSVEPAASQTPQAATAADGDASPIEALLGIPSGEASNEYFSQLMRDAEINIATCMLEQGFTYTPANTDGLIVSDADVDTDSRAFVEQYGFGIASNPFEEAFEQFNPDEDPNFAYMESLSDGERQAYEIALYGDAISDAGSNEVFEPSGCQGDAFDEVFSVFEVFENYSDQFDEISRSFEADPRIVQATAGWSECMAAAGYRFTDEASAVDDIQRRYNSIVSDGSSFLSDDEAFEQAAESQGDDGIVIIGPHSLTPEAQAAVDELAVEERAIATASWDCNGDLREIEDDVRREYEQRFVDQYGSQIRAELPAE